MTSRGWRRPVAVAGVVGCALLAACGESDETTFTPDIAPGSPQDPCRLLSQSEAAQLLGVPQVEAGQAATKDECSYSTTDGADSLAFDIESKLVFDLAIAQAGSTGGAITPVTGVGDQAYYYTRSPGATPSPTSLPSPSASARPSGFSTRVTPTPSPTSLPPATGKVITVLRVKKGSNYYSVLVRKGEAYDLNAERQAALKLIRAS